jgi:hypothetical protein
MISVGIGIVVWEVAKFAIKSIFNKIMNNM